MAGGLDHAHSSQPVVAPTGRARRRREARIAWLLTGERQPNPSPPLRDNLDAAQDRRPGAGFEE